MRKRVSESVPAPTPQAEPIVLDKEGAAKLLLVSPACVYELTRNRAKSRLPFFKVGKYIRFEKSAIVKWMQEEQAKRAA